MDIQPPRHLRGLPGTHLGNLALRIMLPALIVLVALAAVGISGNGGPWAAIPGILAFGSLLAAGELSFVAIAARGERSPVSMVLAAIGIFAFLFLIGELAFPH